MKIIRFFLLCSLGVMLCYPTLAKTPTTAKIAFVSSGRDASGTYYSDISMMNPDGSDLVTLISRSRGINQIAWEPTGERILFCADREGVHDIYVMDADGTNVKPMFTQRRYKREPTWSPDGEWVAYTSPSPSAVWSIYIAPTNGESGIPVARTGRRGGQPAWSPDGSEIAFVFASQGHREIYILNIAEKTVSQLLPKKAPWMLHPTWSPDGEKIAFVWAPENSGSGIYLVNRDGTGLEQIRQPDRLRTVSLTWSPSGDELVYGQDTGDSVQLFKVSLKDRSVQQLTHNRSNTEAIWFDPAGVVAVEHSASLVTTTWGKIKRRD